MKKILYSVLALAIAAFTFTSCEDVPAPYDIPEEGGGGTELPEGVYLDQNFSNSLGEFTSVSASGTLEWYNDYSSAMVSGYQDFDGDGSKENQAGVTYLVSPEIDLTNAQSAHISINHAINYDRGDINDNNSVLISKDYNGNVNTATWKQLRYNTDGLNSSFTFVTNEMNIPAEYLGSKIVVALRHTCTESYSSTWEVKSLLVEEGEVEEVPNEPETPVTGNNLLENGDFETWESTAQPTNWLSASSASKSTLSQSTDAHAGSYSVRVAGASSNQRLSYKEITLKAGTYQMTFYTKAAEDGGSVRPGYTTVTDGVANSQYVYGSYTNDISATEWTEVSYQFTLNETSTLCLVVMIPGSTGIDMLIDDFSLTTEDGGLTDEQPEEPEQPATGYGITTSITSGSKYVIATATEETEYIVGQPVGETSNYGYLPTETATMTNNSIETAESNEFTITAVDGGFTIQDVYGRYYYMSGTFNSFNVSTEMPESGAIWTITFNADNTVNIVNNDKGKTLQYDENYGTYGAYSSVSHALPSLFTKN